MPITYDNRKKKKYYLHRGKTKTGKARYYFSMKNQGDLVNKIPDGFEIYEHPANAQVFLRQKKPQIITDLEKYLVDKKIVKREELDTVDGQVKKEIADAVQFARNSPEPESSTAMDYIYKD